MTLWRPQPFEMDNDPRLLVASAAAQAVAYRLAARAKSGRVAVTDDALAVVRAICGGADWAGDGFRELLDRRLASVADGEIVLVWGWPCLGGNPGGTENSHRTEAARSVADRGTSERASDKRLRALWSKYGIDTPAQRTAWIDTDAARKFIKREGRDASWIAERVSRVRANRRQVGIEQSPTTPRQLSANYYPSPTPPTQEVKSNQSGNARARDEQHLHDNCRDNRSSTTASVPSGVTTAPGRHLALLSKSVRSEEHAAERHEGVTSPPSLAVVGRAHQDEETRRRHFCESLKKRQEVPA